MIIAVTPIVMSRVKESLYFYAPAMTMARALSVTPVRPYVLYLCTYVGLSQRRPLSEWNTFDKNFMKLGHIVEYYDVFFKFDNGPCFQQLWPFV